MRVIVIGGGASGIVAGIFAKRKNNEVTVLERNSKCLKKLLITGNGKCNFFNDDFSIEHYYSDNISDLEDIICEKNKRKVLDFISRIGIIEKVKNGYYYPSSEQAYSVYNSLIKEANVRDVRIENDVKVLNIVKCDNGFIVKTNIGDYKCDKVIVSTGGKSYPKTGSEGDGYIFAHALGHSIVPVYPSLVGLISDNKFIRDLSGVRCYGVVSLYSDDKLIRSEFGEIQFTDYGLSGICVFNLSHYVLGMLNNESIVDVRINFLNCLNIDNFSSFVNFFNERNKFVKNRNVIELLEGFLNYKVVNSLIKMCRIEVDSSWDRLSDIKKKNLFECLSSYKFNIVGTKGFDMAQVSIGGVSLSDVNVNNFESRVVPGLYFTGEVLDVTGDCGGYNLGFAFLSGMIAGESVGDSCD